MFRTLVAASVAVMKTFEELLAAWSRAEARADAEALGLLLAVDFRGDGPLGFVLDREQWLDRYRRGELQAEAFAWSPTEVRVLNQAAIAIGLLSQVARYRGLDCSGVFVCTLVAVRVADRWAIVNVQLGQRLP
jgi:hypothetical protein